jgi:predicted nucleotidyltransferase
MAGPDHTDVLNVKQLSAKQRELVASLAERFGAIDGMRAVVLAGSYARGRAQPGSDIDLGLLYSETAPFTIASVRELAEAVNDTAGLVVTDFYGWGPWVGYDPRSISAPVDGPHAAVWVHHGHVANAPALAVKARGDRINCWVIAHRLTFNG